MAYDIVVYKHCMSIVQVHDLKPSLPFVMRFL